MAIGNPAQVPRRTRHQICLQRKNALDTERQSYMTHWQDISQVLSPRNSRFLQTDTNNGTKKHNNIYDSTATRAHRVLTAGLMAGATSPARPWFRVTTPDPDLAEFDTVKEWLFMLSRLIRLIFDRSNTYRALPKIYKQLSGYGTAASVLEPHFETVIHQHVQAIGEYMLGTNQFGMVDTFAREFEMSVAQVVGKFGYDQCSRTVKNLYDTFSYDAEVGIVHLIQPRELSKRDTRKRDNLNMQFESIYLETGQENAEVEGGLLRESGYRDFPVLAPRWETLGLDAYGSDCPGMTMLGDIKQLQFDQKQKAKAVEYQSDPPVQVPSAMRNQENDLLPGGVSYFDGAGPNAGIRSAFDVPLRLDHLQLGIQDTRQQITSGFYADLFLMLMNDSRSNITAREIAERHEEKLLMVGPVLENIHNELLSPLIDYTFTRVIEAGIMPPPPPELQEQELKIEFVSMLAQAQKAVGLSSVDRLLGTVGAVAQGQQAAGRSPDVWDKLDTDEIIDNYADMLGVDPSLIIADDEVAIIRADRAKTAAMAQTQAMAAQSATTAKTLSETDTENPSALKDVVGAFSGYGGT